MYNPPPTAVTASSHHISCTFTTAYACIHTSKSPSGLETRHTVGGSGRGEGGRAYTASGIYCSSRPTTKGRQRAVLLIEGCEIAVSRDFEFNVTLLLLPWYYSTTEYRCNVHPETLLVDFSSVNVQFWSSLTHPSDPPLKQFRQ